MQVIKAKCKENPSFLHYMRGYLDSIGQSSKFFRFYQCSSKWALVTYLDKNNKHHYRTVYRNACHDKFCNICSWQSAKNNKYNIAKVLLQCKYKHHKAFIFLRLSSQSCSEANLNNRLKELQTAFNRFSQHRSIKKTVKGYIRKLEITYNNGNYNPHFHVLLAVDYCNLYSLKKKLLFNIWQKSCKDLTVGNIHVNYVDTSGYNAYKIGNYLSKPPIKDYTTINQDIFNCLHHNLLGKQLLVFGGICKQIKRELATN